MQCFVIDDQEHAIINLSRQILKTPGLTLAGSDTDPVNAVNKITSGVVQADIVFTDIEMPSMTGIEVAERINDRAAVIAVTGHADYAIEAIDIGIVGYLTKPISTEHFLRAVERAKRWLDTIDRRMPRRRDSIYLRVDNHHDEHVLLDNLVWLEVSSKQVLLHLIRGKPIPILSSLSAFEGILPGTQFLRIHKGHIVNLNFVLSRSYNQVKLSTGKILDIGPTYMETYRKKMIGG